MNPCEKVIEQFFETQYLSLIFLFILIFLRWSISTMRDFIGFRPLFTHQWHFKQINLMKADIVLVWPNAVCMDVQQGWRRTMGKTIIIESVIGMYESVIDFRKGMVILTVIHAVQGELRKLQNLKTLSKNQKRALSQARSWRLLLAASIIELDCRTGWRMSCALLKMVLLYNVTCQMYPNKSRRLMVYIPTWLHLNSGNINASFLLYYLTYSLYHHIKFVKYHLCKTMTFITLHLCFISPFNKTTTVTIRLLNLTLPKLPSRNFHLVITVLLLAAVLQYMAF